MRASTSRKVSIGFGEAFVKSLPNRFQAGSETRLCGSVWILSHREQYSQEVICLQVLQGLAKSIAWDGEGATCLIEVHCLSFLRLGKRLLVGAATFSVWVNKVEFRNSSQNAPQVCFSKLLKYSSSLPNCQIAKLALNELLRWGRLSIFALYLPSSECWSGNLNFACLFSKRNFQSICLLPGFQCWGSAAVLSISFFSPHSPPSPSMQTCVVS